MDLNDYNDEAFCIDSGRLFHRRGVETEKALSPAHFLNLGTKTVEQNVFLYSLFRWSFKNKPVMDIALLEIY